MKDNKYKYLKYKNSSHTKKQNKKYTMSPRWLGSCVHTTIRSIRCRDFQN